MTESSVHLEGRLATITTTLLGGVRRGDAPAWERLVELYVPLVYWWCKRTGLQDADILDVGQEVLLTLRRNLPGFRCESPTDTFRGWLRQITANAICEHFRRQGKQPLAEGGSEARARFEQIAALDESDDAQAAELQILGARVVESVRLAFSERDWQAAYRVLADDQRPADVALELGVTRNQVYLAVSRIRKRLSEQLIASGKESP